MSHILTQLRSGQTLHVQFRSHVVSLPNGATNVLPSFPPYRSGGESTLKLYRRIFERDLRDDPPTTSAEQVVQSLIRVGDANNVRSLSYIETLVLMTSVLVSRGAHVCWMTDRDQSTEKFWTDVLAVFEDADIATARERIIVLSRMFNAQTVRILDDCCVEYDRLGAAHDEDDGLRACRGGSSGVLGGDSVSSSSSAVHSNTLTRLQSTETIAYKVHTPQGTMERGTDTVYFTFEKVSGENIAFWMDFHAKQKQQTQRSGAFVPEEPGYTTHDGVAVPPKPSKFVPVIDGVGSFKNSLDLFSPQNFDLWIAYAANRPTLADNKRVLHDGANQADFVEMAVPVFLSAASPITTHMGIFRTYKFYGRFPGFRMHANLAMHLHAFAARMSCTIFPGTPKQCMVTNPADAMRGIMITSVSTTAAQHNVPLASVLSVADEHQRRRMRKEIVDLAHDQAVFAQMSEWTPESLALFTSIDTYTAGRIRRRTGTQRPRQFDPDDDDDAAEEKDPGIFTLEELVGRELAAQAAHIVYTKERKEWFPEDANAPSFFDPSDGGDDAWTIACGGGEPIVFTKPAWFAHIDLLNHLPTLAVDLGTLGGASLPLRAKSPTETYRGGLSGVLGGDAASSSSSSSSSSLLTPSAAPPHNLLSLDSDTLARTIIQKHLNTGEVGQLATVSRATHESVLQSGNRAFFDQKAGRALFKSIRSEFVDGVYGGNKVVGVWDQPAGHRLLGSGLVQAWDLVAVNEELKKIFNPSRPRPRRGDKMLFWTAMTLRMGARPAHLAVFARPADVMCTPKLTLSEYIGLPDKYHELAFSASVVSLVLEDKLNEEELLLLLFTCSEQNTNLFASSPNHPFHNMTMLAEIQHERRENGVAHNSVNWNGLRDFKEVFPQKITMATLSAFNGMLIRSRLYGECRVAKEAFARGLLPAMNFFAWMDDANASFRDALWVELNRDGAIERSLPFAPWTAESEVRFRASVAGANTAAASAAASSSSSRFDYNKFGKGPLPHA